MIAATDQRSALEEARRYLVGGVNSPVRAFRHIGGEPLLLHRAKGAEVEDVQGRRFLDFIAGWGAILLGHNPPAVVDALRRRADAGVLLGLTHPAEAELARLITEAVPSVEQVRFTVSGTEADLTAARLAMGITGRRAVLAFDGCYHGHAVLAPEVIRVPYNDPAALEAALQRHGQQLACVIVEPVAANMGVVPPEPGFLARVRDLTSRQGILLIFDEVVTGFRLGAGGAQGSLGVTPDLTVFGKIIGGGLPIGAVGGPRRLLQRLAPEGDVYHGGTFAGHPLSMAAGIAALRELAAHPPYESLERRSGRLADGLLRESRAHGVSLRVNRAGSMLTVFFADRPVRNEADAKASRRDRFAQWARALLAQGILVPPSPFEALFLTTAHTDEHVERLIRASGEAFQSWHE